MHKTGEIFTNQSTSHEREDPMHGKDTADTELDSTFRLGTDGLVEGRDGVAKVPGRETVPCPRCLHLHSAAPGAHVDGIRNKQCAQADH